MVAGPGIERNEGMIGFDWVTHRGDPQPANADMRFTGLLPPDLDNIRDRFDNVEGLSGWRQSDVLRGDDTDAAALAGDHELTRPELVDGLSGSSAARPVHRRQHHHRRGRQRPHGGPRRQRPHRRRRLARRPHRRAQRDGP